MFPRLVRFGTVCIVKALFSEMRFLGDIRDPAGLFLTEKQQSRQSTTCRPWGKR
jgi:hypothetical protein